MLILTYLTAASAMSRLSRVGSPAAQLRFGALLLRPNRAASATEASLRPHVEAVCGAMARGVLNVRLGSKTLDQTEVRELLTKGSIAEKVAAPRPAIKLPELPKAPEPESEPAAAEPAAAEPAAEEASAAEPETTEPEAPAPEAPAPEAPVAAPAPTPSKKKRS